MRLARTRIVFFCSAGVSSCQFDILDNVCDMVMSFVEPVIETMLTYSVRVDDLSFTYAARLCVNMSSTDNEGMGYVPLDQAYQN